MIFQNVLAIEDFLKQTEFRLINFSKKFKKICILIAVQKYNARPEDAAKDFNAPLPKVLERLKM